MAPPLRTRRTLLGPPHELPAAVGLRVSLPLVALFHAVAAAALLHASWGFDPAGLPVPRSKDDVLRLVAPPPAALPEGDPAAPRNPERVAPGSTARPLPSLTLPPLEPAPLETLLEALEGVATGPAASFGALDGLPEGLFDGLPFGRPEGVVGGADGGVPGGRIGGLPGAADPVFPPPDEPPAAISMPRPRFPPEALRDGVRGSVRLRAVINERGRVEVLRVVHSVPGLDAEAIRVVEAEWRFRPARRNGRPVSSLSDLTVRFALH